MAMEQHLNGEDIKSKEVDRLLVENNNQMVFQLINIVESKVHKQACKISVYKDEEAFRFGLGGQEADSNSIWLEEQGGV